MIVAAAGLIAGREGAAQRSASPAAAMVTGGPFQRVVYRVRSHTLLAVPGVFRSGSLEFRSATIQYDDRTHIAWSDGPSTVTRDISRATAGFATANFTLRTVTLGGGVNFQAISPATSEHAAIDFRLRCPAAVYDAARDTVESRGAVAGKVQAPYSLPGAGVSALLSGAATASPTTAASPIQVSAASLAYRVAPGVLTGSGSVRFSQAGDTIQAPNMLLNAAARLMRLWGGVCYTDSAGRRFCGVSALEDLRTKRLDVQGPITFRDREGDIATAGAATMDKQAGAAYLRGNVSFTNPEGTTAKVPWATVRFDASGARKRLDTGPLGISGKAAVTAPGR